MSDTEYDAYASMPGLSWSRDLKGYTVSGLHGRYHAEHPPPDSDTFRFGRLLHSLVLEPHRASQVFAAMPAEHCKALARYRDKAADPDSRKEWDEVVALLVDGRSDLVGAYDGVRDPRHKAYKAWLAENPGRMAVSPSTLSSAQEVAELVRSTGTRTPISVDTWADAERKAHAVTSHRLTRGYLASSTLIREQAVTWTDARTGLVLKAKVDGVDPDRRLLMDLKMARTISPVAFGRHATDYGYHAQLAGQYAEACRHAHGFEPERIVLLLVERAPTNDVGVVEFGPEEIDAGYRVWRNALDLLAECRERGEYPGQYDGPRTLALRPHVYDVDDELTFGGN